MKYYLFIYFDKINLVIQKKNIIEYKKENTFNNRKRRRKCNNTIYKYSE